MSMAEEIRILCVKAGNVSDAELARRLGTSPQNFFNQMKRDNFTVDRVREIADVLGFDMEITFKKRDDQQK